MTTEEITVRVLVPSEGMRLTDGVAVAEGKVYLGIHDSPENWREITVAEAEEIEAGRGMDVRLQAHSAAATTNEVTVSYGPAGEG